MNEKVKQWIVKRKWDILFGVFFVLIVFVPSVRMPVVSTIQRLLAFSPSELSEEKIIDIQSYDWELIDLENNQTNFSMSEGRVALVNLWATWCPPCIAEMPSLQKLYDKYGDKIDFYLVSNEQPATIQRFLSKNKYTFPIYMPEGFAPREFESNSLPTTYVINKKGEIIMKEIGAHDWFSRKFQKKIDELIEE